MHKRIAVLTFILFLAFIMVVGCSGRGDDLSSPSLNSHPATPAIPTSHQLLGFWDVAVIPDGEGSADVIFTPLRSTQIHMNVVGIMEAGGGAAVGVEPPVTFADGVLSADIRLTHPFSGLDKFTGFDVRGILIGHGSMGGFSESLFYAGANDLDLLNADGHSRLWNPTEYTGNGYIDGKMGVPDAIANYTATLNGYKYFADDLTPDMPVREMLISNRGAFTAGSNNARHYKIKLGDQGLTFQYAVDANWWKPTEPIEIPGSFDVERANCPEPYHIDAIIGPGIHGDGGSASYTVDVYDWQYDIDTAYLEAPQLVDGVITLTDPEIWEDFVRFTGTLTNENLPAGDHVDVLFYARGVDPVSATTYTDYHLYRLPTPRVPTEGVIITIQDDMAYKTYGVEYEYGGKDYDYATAEIPPVDYNDNDGIWDFTLIPNDASGIRKAIEKSDPEVAGFANEFSSNVTHFFKTQLGIGGETSEIYQAEEHNEGTNQLKMWGIYSVEELMEGLHAIQLDPPIIFQYPMDIDTHYKVEKTYTLIPFLLTFTIAFERWAIGEGVAFAPVEPGVNGWGWEAQPSLATRTEAYFETGGILGQGPMGSGLMYEWIADDGTLYGTIMTGNQPDEDPNYDEGTFEITGAANVLALRSIS